MGPRQIRQSFSIPRAVSLMCSSVSRHTHRIRCKGVLVLDIPVFVLSRNVLPPIPCFMWGKRILVCVPSRRACDQSRKPKYWRAVMRRSSVATWAHAAIHCVTFEVPLPYWVRKTNLALESIFLWLKQKQDCRLVPHHHSPTLQELTDVFINQKGKTKHMTRQMMCFLSSTVHPHVMSDIAYPVLQELSCTTLCVPNYSSTSANLFSHIPTMNSNVAASLVFLHRNSCIHKTSPECPWQSPDTPKYHPSKFDFA